MNEYRHVCFKDLNDYFKRNDYFEGLTDPEKQLILNNLGITDLIDKLIARIETLENK